MPKVAKTKPGARKAPMIGAGSDPICTTLNIISPMSINAEPSSRTSNA
jgi:hypothetical protein